MKTTYKVTHLIYELTESGDMSDPVECEIDGYGSVEELKAETTEVIEKMISDYKIPDGRIVTKMQIERKTVDDKGNVKDVYYDSDSAEFVVKNGKIKDCGDTVC